MDDKQIRYKIRIISDFLNPINKEGMGFLEKALVDLKELIDHFTFRIDRGKQLALFMVYRSHQIGKSKALIERMIAECDGVMDIEVRASGEHAVIKDMCKAFTEIKTQIAFIDHPKDPKNSEGSDWSKVVKLMDALELKYPMTKESSAPEKSCSNCDCYMACNTGFHELAASGLSKIAKKSTDAIELQKALFESIAKYCKEYNINQKKEV